MIIKYQGTVGDDVEDALVKMRAASHDKNMRVETTWNEVVLSVGPRATLAEIAKVSEYYRLCLR